MEKAQGSWQMDLEPSEMVTDSSSVWAALGPEKRKKRPLGFPFPQLCIPAEMWACLDLPVTRTKKVGRGGREFKPQRMQTD